MTHWKTLYDTNDGEPYGTVCSCGIDVDHDGNGTPNNPAHVAPVSPFDESDPDTWDGDNLPDGYVWRTLKVSPTGRVTTQHLFAPDGRDLSIVDEDEDDDDDDD